MTLDGQTLKLSDESIIPAKASIVTDVEITVAHRLTAINPSDTDIVTDRITVGNSNLPQRLQALQKAIRPDHVVSALRNSVKK